MEIWKTITDFPNYEVSNLGNIRRIRDKKIMKQYWDVRYFRINLSHNGKKTKCSVHRLVALYHVTGQSNEKNVVNHKDGNRRNNNSDNIEWVTEHENVKHAIDTGLRDNKGMAQTNSKLSDDDIKFIRANFKKCDPVYGGIPLAKRFGVYKSTIYKIVQGRAWKHI